MPSAQEENNIVTSSSSGGDKYFKYAIVALVVIATIVLAEGAYLYFTQQESQTAIQEEVSDLKREIASPTPTPNPASERTRGNIDLAEVESFLKYRERSNPSGFYLGANITWTVAGRVTQTSETEGSDETGTNFITITNQDGEIFSIFFNQREKNNARVIIKGSEPQPANFEDIGVGDFATIKVIENLLDSTNDDLVIFEVEKSNLP